MPVIFTPDNEPYLGRESVFRFDQQISALMEQQVAIATWTHSHQLTPLQVAASELVPGACSLVLTIRELVRQAYLFGAMVLLRPLVERVGTLTYLIERPEALPAWAAGWKQGSRPSFRELLRTLRGPSDSPAAPSPDDQRLVANHYHELVHGGPAAAAHSLIVLPEGAPAFTTGKDTASPDRADAVCFEATMYAIVLTARCAQLFPDALYP